MDIEQRIFVGGEKKNLVGEDFYVKYKCVWEHYTNELLIKCELTEGKRTNYIFCTETVQVPGDHETIIPSKLTYRGSQRTTTQSFVISHQMTVAKTLLNANTGVMLICVFNPGEKPRLIKRCTLIASFIQWSMLVKQLITVVAKIALLTRKTVKCRNT